MENQNNKIKYLIIIAVFILVVLLFVYLFIRSRSSQPITPSTPEPSPTVFVFPSSTPFPSPEIPISISQEDMQNYSPADQKTLDMRDEYEAINNPDLTVKNNTPFENEYFMVVPVPVETSKGGYYKIAVYPLNDDQALVETKFKEWLRSIRLPDESIAKLMIEYQQPKLPSADIDF